MASAIGVIIGIVFVITLDFLGPFFLRASPVSTNKALSTFPLLTTFLLVITATLLAAVRPARKAAMTSPIEAISRVPPSGRKIIKIYQIALSLVFTTIGILALGRFGSNPEASLVVFLGFFGFIFYLCGLVLIVANIMPLLSRLLVKLQRRYSVLTLAAPSFATAGRGHFGAALAFLAFSLVFVFLIGGSASIFESKVLFHKQAYSSSYAIDAKAANYYAPGFGKDLRKFIAGFHGVKKTAGLKIKQFMVDPISSRGGVTLVAIKPSEYVDVARVKASDRALIKKLGFMDLLVTKQTLVRLRLRIGDKLKLRDLADDKIYSLYIRGVVGIDPVEGNNGAFVSQKTGSHLRMIYDNRLLLKAKPSNRLKNALTAYLDKYYPQLRLIGENDVRAEVWRGILTTQAVPLIGTAAVLYVVSFLSLANTIIASVWSRRQEIALLRALGASRHQIAASVTLEGIISAVIGTIPGLLGGIALLWILISRMAVSAQAQGYTYVLNVPWWAILMIIFLSIVSAFAASVIPSQKVSKMSITEELRYE